MFNFIYSYYNKNFRTCQVNARKAIYYRRNVIFLQRIPYINYDKINLEMLKSFIENEKIFGAGIDEQNSLLHFTVVKSQNTPPEHSVQTLRRSAKNARRVPDQDAPVFHLEQLFELFRCETSSR